MHTSYTAPLEEIDYALPDHAEWLTKQFEAGYFLATDPFALQHLVHHEVVEFQVGRTAPGLLRYNEAALPG